MLDILALSFMEGIGTQTAHAILNHFGSASAFFKADADTCLHAGLHASIVERFQSLSDQAHRRAEKEIRQTQKHGVHIMACNDPAYPNTLKFCNDAPLVLYYRGTLENGTPNGIAIVGTRKATHYGQESTQNLVEALKNDPVHIVSGLALGIDTFAHEASIAHRLPTWAVLAHGLEYIYPEKNEDLAARIVKEGGAIISEMPLFTITKPGLFPRRNRIIAGLTKVTVVVESDIKGGAMHTARDADSYQRTVFAVPGRNNDPYSKGCNHLIRTGKAVLMQSAEDIRQELGYCAMCGERNLFSELEEAPVIRFTPNPEQAVLLDVFKESNPVSLDFLQAKSGKPVHEMLPVLLQLEMNGVIKSLPGNRYEQISVLK